MQADQGGWWNSPGALELPGAAAVPLPGRFADKTQNKLLLMALDKPPVLEGHPGHALVPADLLRFWQRHCWRICSCPVQLGAPPESLRDGANSFFRAGIPLETDAVPTAAQMQSLHFGLFALVAIIYYTHRGTH